MQSTARKLRKLVRAAGVVAAVSIALGASNAGAQEAFPSKPITIMHGFLPGGSTDIIARTIGAGMSARLGQPVVVESRSGAGGAVMLGHVARQSPDGYTLAVATSSAVTQATQIDPSLPYDPLKDFVPITKLGDQAMLIVTSSKFAQDISDFIAIAKKKPVTVGLYVPINKIILAAISQATGAQFINVQYRGLADAVPAVLGGHVDSIFESPNTSLGAVKEGKYRALVVTTAKRSSMLPDVPTVQEALKIPGFDFGVWYGMLAPAGTPADRVERIYQSVAATLKEPKVREAMANAALEGSGNTPKEFATLIKSEYDRDGAIIRKYNIK